MTRKSVSLRFKTDPASQASARNLMEHLRDTGVGQSLENAVRPKRRRPEQTSLPLPDDLRRVLDTIAREERTPGGRSGLIQLVLRDWISARAAGFSGFDDLAKVVRELRDGQRGGVYGGRME